MLCDFRGYEEPLGNGGSSSSHSSGRCRDTAFAHAWANGGWGFQHQRSGFDTENDRVFLRVP